MKSKILLFIFLLTFSLANAQKATSFDKLLNETKKYLSIYSKLYTFSENYYKLSELGLSKQEIQKLVDNSADENTFTPNKDSVVSYIAIEVVQGKIEDCIYKMIAHKDFRKKDLSSLTSEGELSIVISPDNKLYNFSFDAKTGGTYRSRISIMYYAELDSAQTIGEQVIEDSENSDKPFAVFSSDGYSLIDTVQTTEGVKYILSGSVIGCTSCFAEYISLVSYQNKKFVEEFSYSTSLRGFEPSIDYNPATKTISVSYNTDDLTPYCKCMNSPEEEENTSDGEESYWRKHCECVFEFNGKNYELVKEGWEKIKEETEEE